MKKFYLAVKPVKADSWEWTWLATEKYVQNTKSKDYITNFAIVTMIKPRTPRLAYTFKVRCDYNGVVSYLAVNGYVK